MNSEDRLQDDEPSTTVVPMLQPARSPKITPSRLRYQRLTCLMGGMVFLTLSLITVIFMIRNRPNISGSIVYFWAGIGVGVPLIAGINLLSKFTAKSARDARVSEESKICAVEVCIDNETVLTVRSWWPSDMNRTDIERNGVRVAMSSAQRWISDNSHHGGKTSRIRFDLDSATLLSRQYLTRPCCAGSDHQCSVCLDSVSCPEHASTGVELRGCGHVFHEDCLASWFAQSSKLTCPMCRSDHHHLVPPAILAQYVDDQKPSVHVLSIAVEDGVIPLNNINVH